MNEKTSPDAQVPFDPALVAAAVAAARDDGRGICKLGRHGIAFTFDFGGEETILADDMRPVVERALGEKLAECLLPGLEGQLNLMPMSRAIALGICAAADIERRRPTGLTNDASVLAPDCRGCLAIVPHGTAYCSACAIPAPDPSRLPMRSRMVVLLRKVHTGRTWCACGLVSQHQDHPRRRPQLRLEPLGACQWCRRCRVQGDPSAAQPVRAAGGRNARLRQRAGRAHRVGGDCWLMFFNEGSDGFPLRPPTGAAGNRQPIQRGFQDVLSPSSTSATSVAGQGGTSVPYHQPVRGQAPLGRSLAHFWSFP